MYAEKRWLEPQQYYLYRAVQVINENDPEMSTEDFDKLNETLESFSSASQDSFEQLQTELNSLRSRINSLEKK